jgi:hypothetical protein
VRFLKIPKENASHGREVPQNAQRKCNVEHLKSKEYLCGTYYFLKYFLKEIFFYFLKIIFNISTMM